MKSCTLEQDPSLRAQVEQLNDSAWPEFLNHGDTRYWDQLYDSFAFAQVCLCADDGQLLAVGHMVPFTWQETIADLPAKVDTIMVRAVEGLEMGRETHTIAALAAIVSPAHQGKGLSKRLLQEMKARVIALEAQRFIVPVRPVWKHRYPLTPFSRYITWQRADGLFYDPWLRVHQRLGSETLAIASQAVTVRGRVADWVEWTGMVFPETGRYIVPEAMQPVMIDRELDQGVYHDPAVWLEHPLP